MASLFYIKKKKKTKSRTNFKMYRKKSENIILVPIPFKLRYSQLSNFNIVFLVTFKFNYFTVCL